MDTRKLKYFIALCEEMNYRKAAERLFITQPTLSQQIKQLETDLDMNLFNREHNTISLTKEGTMLLSQSYHVIKEINALSLKLDEYKGKIDHEIVVGVTGANLILTPIQNFALEYSDAKISIKEHSIKTLRDLVTKNLIDFGLCYLSDEEDTLLVREIIGHDSFACVTPLDHPLTHKDSITIRDILPHSLILAQTGLATSKSLSHYEAMTNIKLVPNYEMPNYNACLSLVKKNLGISILPRSFLSSNDPEDYCSLPIRDLKEGLDIALIYRRDHVFTTTENALIQSIRTFIAEVES